MARGHSSSTCSPLSTIPSATRCSPPPVLGSTPDADHLLAPAADELAGRLDDLLQHGLTRRAVPAYEGMAYMPQPVLTRLTARLTDQDMGVRYLVVGALMTARALG